MVNKFLKTTLLGFSIAASALYAAAEESYPDKPFSGQTIRKPAVKKPLRQPRSVSMAEAAGDAALHTVNFHDVPVTEFIKYVSRISNANFIFDNRELQFNITLSSGKPVSSAHIVKALVQILRVHGFSVLDEDGYLVVHKGSALPGGPARPLIHDKVILSEDPEIPAERMIAALDPPLPEGVEPQFWVYKLKYHAGNEIEETIKKISADLATKPGTSVKYLNALRSIQWVKSTNSLVCTGDNESLVSVSRLVETLDAPLRQVFIEVLVIETDVRKSSEFGLQWAAGGKYRDSVGFGTGNFIPGGGAPFAFSFQNTGPGQPPSGPNQIPMGHGFDLGVIGDIIMHKGRSFLTLGSLISALQRDGDSTIVLNQKIITQDNKNSTIFVGDNIPFTGSIVSTVGQSQQTTANVEYRDIGVTLSITPKLGEEDVITLDITEEITEIIPTMGQAVSNSQVNGIQTTKTNMMTHVHVPDKHFLVLSGMIRNTKMHHKTGIPCLGGLPIIGAAFSKNEKLDEKKNVIIFVRPQIVHSMEDYGKITDKQEALFESQAAPRDFKEGVDLVK